MWHPKLLTLGTAGNRNICQHRSIPGDCVSHSPWPGQQQWSVHCCADVDALDLTGPSHCCSSPMIHLKYHNTIKLVSLKLILLKDTFSNYVYSKTMMLKQKVCHKNTCINLQVLSEKSPNSLTMFFHINHWTKVQSSLVKENSSISTYKTMKNSG